MKLTIFSRMVISLLAIFILSMAASLYCILQLRQLDKITEVITKDDANFIFLQQDLLNTFFSMMRYEKKYFIMKDEGLYNQYLLVKVDFDKYLNDIADIVSVAEVEAPTSVACTAEARDLLTKINQNYQFYQSSFDEESNHLRSGTEYDQEGIQRKRNNAADEIMDNLEKLGKASSTTAITKAKQLGDAEDRARKAAIGISIAALAAIIAISIMLTITITHPLAAMKKKTREIAKGDFGNDLQLSSPPEIKELAQSFNAMCRRLKQIDKIKSAFF